MLNLLERLWSASAGEKLLWNSRIWFKNAVCVFKIDSAVEITLRTLSDGSVRPLSFYF
jgi:hypothetical protein